MQVPYCWNPPIEAYTMTVELYWSAKRPRHSVFPVRTRSPWITSGQHQTIQIIHINCTRQWGRRANKSTTPRTALSKEELSLVGFEPTTLCSLGECSANWATRGTQLVGVQIYNMYVYMNAGVGVASSGSPGPSLPERQGGRPERGLCWDQQ